MLLVPRGMEYLACISRHVTSKALMTATYIQFSQQLTYIQSGMIMALQLTDKRMLFDYAVTQLQHFLIECGRTTHTILQSDQDLQQVLATRTHPECAIKSALQ